jgi:hypothetical protein
MEKKKIKMFVFVKKTFKKIYIINKKKEVIYIQYKNMFLNCKKNKDY